MESGGYIVLLESTQHSTVLGRSLKKGLDFKFSRLALLTLENSLLTSFRSILFWPSWMSIYDLWWMQLSWACPRYLGPYISKFTGRNCQTLEHLPPWRKLFPSMVEIEGIFPAPNASAGAGSINRITHAIRSSEVPDEGLCSPIIFALRFDDIY